MGNADDTCLCLLNTCMQPNLFTCSHAEGECECEREEEMRRPCPSDYMHRCTAAVGPRLLCIGQMQLQLQCNKLKREKRRVVDDRHSWALT